MTQMSDVELAVALADAAGKILKQVRETGLLTGKALGKAGDETANAFLMHAIKAMRPEDGVLSEESKDDLSRLEQSRVWIIDPVDGTREYGEARNDWAVHVGLSIDGKPHTGAVALPDRDMVLETATPPALKPMNTPPKMVVSRSRPAQEAVSVAEKVGAELLPMGSAGAKAMAVVLGEADIYVHSGGQYEWDNCAPVAIALAAGLFASRLDGSEFKYNCEDPYLPDLIICRQELAEHVKNALKKG